MFPPLLPVVPEFPTPLPPAAAAATEDLVRILLCYYCMACELTVVKLVAEAAVEGVVDDTRN
jgi:hypothetical protein